MVGKYIFDYFNSVKDKLEKVGVKNIQYKLYENGRHEILNEINKDEVIDDILIWMNGIL